MKEFEIVAKSTECPYAYDAKLVFADAVYKGCMKDYVWQCRTQLIEFCASIESESLDGFVFGFPPEANVSSDEELGALVCELLQEIASWDADASRSLSALSVESKWRLFIQGKPFFLISLADFYDATSSRYTFGVKGAFIVLQPTDAFRRRRVPGADILSMALVHKIRKRYRQNGRPYDDSLVDSLNEALRYIRPEKLGGPAITWWSMSEGRKSDS
jgi:hypothetical protein